MLTHKTTLVEELQMGSLDPAKHGQLVRLANAAPLLLAELEATEHVCSSAKSPQELWQWLRTGDLPQRRRAAISAATEKQLKTPHSIHTHMERLHPPL